MAQEKETIVSPVENAVDNAVDNAAEISYLNTIKKLIASGCKRINNVRIKNVNCTEKDNYTMISLTLANQVKGFVSEDGGITYKEGMTNVIFSSTYSLASVIKNDEDLAFCANTLVESPNAFEVVLSGATIDIIQQPVAADELYKNPFSTSDSEGVALGHDTIINHVINIVPSKRAMAVLDRVALSMFGL